MNELQDELIKTAVTQYRRIFPCGNKSNIEDGFTVEGHHLLFWFNTEDNSTHLLSREI